MIQILKFLNISLLASFLLVGCTYDYVMPECDKLALQRSHMSPYRGQAIEGCTVYLVKYKWKDEFYFDPEYPCLDVVTIPLNCNGESLADSLNDPLLIQYWSERAFVEIVGIDK